MRERERKRERDKGEKVAEWKRKEKNKKIEKNVLFKEKRQILHQF